ncbi:DNA excision repair protein ERCC-2 [Actimicrobium sp. GrIS 1.19]|uniref:helicase C-terminal domain-containing protein n=1 Tax=Actimicrobium sp. GrIS 1.19 TaxID=3071708 RepID=UPI002DF9AE09|nr:DNA excision repair protein ERCC-2 [Actimicrobium sp. GrIS 1.19]
MDRERVPQTGQVNAAPGQYVVAVRALCEFTAKQGDLDLRFTPSPTAQEGIAGHTLVTGRRNAGYESEIRLAGNWRQLHVRGRADGYDPAANQLEEIKTFRGDLARMPDNHRHLHWAQLRIYGWLLCQQRGLAALTLALVYLDIGTQQETVLTEECEAATLQAFFEQHCERFLAWAEQELVHRRARDAAWTALPFPHATFRPGQRELAQAVYQAATSGRCLLAQAPTGIGKTIGTLFPLIKAAPAQQLDKIFFLTAKTSGRALALDAVTLLRQAAPTLPLRVVELVARDKACEYPELACHGDSCPLARGFYDRLPQARAAAVQRGTLDRNSLRDVALSHQVCPYYLGQDLVRWSDLVIGDYNYYFDASAMLFGLSVANQWQVAVLVDEAHNLIERGRKMYSAELDQRAFNRLRLSAPALLRGPLDRLSRQWNALLKTQQAPYQVWPAPPEKFLAALQLVISAIGEFFNDNPTRVDAVLQRFYFDALQFSRLVDSFDANTLFDISKTGQHDSVLCLRNVIPAPFLAPRFAASRSTTLFSATLSPWHFYSDTLGLPSNAGWIDVVSPFTAAQLLVRVVSSISTRYQHRDASLAPIVALIAQQFGERSGNYLVFLSSFAYLQQLTALFRQCHPQIPMWEQERSMDEAARERFLQRFAIDGQGVGFAVLGGAFAEGIDLPGNRLIGAFIATLGLPQVNPVNEQIMRRIEAQLGNGYDSTYLFPGLQKVVQAAGRVIRTQSDEGIVVLIDDRFLRAEVRALLPRWWHIGSST